MDPVVAWIMGIVGALIAVGFAAWLASIHRQIAESRKSFEDQAAQVWRRLNEFQVALSQRSERIATVEEAVRSIRSDISEMKAILLKTLAENAALLQMEKFRGEEKS